MIWGADDLPLGRAVSIAGVIAFVDTTLVKRTNKGGNAMIDIFKDDVLLPVMCDLRQLGLPDQQLRAIKRPKTETRLMLVTRDEIKAAEARGEAPQCPHVTLLTRPLILTPIPTVVVEAPLFSPYAGHRVFQVVPRYRGRVALEDLA